MFAITCPVREAPVLIWPSRIEELHSTPAGIEITFRCVCGHQAVLRTGRLAGGDELLRHDSCHAVAAAV